MLYIVCIGQVMDTCHWLQVAKDCIPKPCICEPPFGPSHVCNGFALAGNVSLPCLICLTLEERLLDTLLCLSTLVFGGKEGVHVDINAYPIC